MADKKIDIKLGTYFDKSGVTEANSELAKLAESVKDVNQLMQQATLRSAGDTMSYAALADKAVKAMGGSYKTLDEQLAELATKTSKVGETALQAGSISVQSGTKVSTIVSALHGNIDSMAKLVGDLGGRFLAVGKIGVGTLGAIGAAVMGVWEFLKAGKDLISTVFKWGQASDEIKAMGKEMSDLANAQSILTERMSDARRMSDESLKSRQREIDQTHDLTKAELELAKAKEMSMAVTQDQKDEIDRRYSSALADADDERQRLTRDSKRQALLEERDRIQQEQSQAEKALRRYRKLYADGGQTGTDEALDQRDIIDRKKEELRLNDAALAALDHEEEVAESLILARKIAEETAAVEAAEKREAEEIKAADEILKQRKAEELKEIEEIRRAREQAEKDLHKIRLDNIRAEIADGKQAASDQSLIASTAQSEFDRAFAMYRDPSAAKRQIEEERDYAEDYKQLQKDANRYGGKWRIDTLAQLMANGDTQGQRAQLEEWRKSRSFTPEVEAMVRASAADQTRTTAEDELRKINHHTELLANKLDELLKVK